jgi:hypothetical protein
MSTDFYRQRLKTLELIYHGVGKVDALKKEFGQQTYDNIIAFLSEKKLIISDESTANIHESEELVFFGLEAMRLYR